MSSYVSPKSRSKELFRVTSVFGVLLLAGALAGCGTGKRVERDANGKAIPSLADQDPIASLYAKSVSEAGSGKACSDQTLQVLTCFAYRGRGYEEAQYALGECLIASGQDAPTGIEWVKRGAQGGNAEAQIALAQIYEAGKITSRDLPAAAFWNSLYIRNPSLLTLGAVPDGALSQKLTREMSADQIKNAQAQAQAFTPIYWAPTSTLDQETAVSCGKVRGVPQKIKIPTLNPGIDQAPTYPTGK